MNDETRESRPANSVELAAENTARDDLIEGLQNRVDELEEQLLVARKGGAVEQKLLTPNDFVNELKALAATIRNCQRNGHPDAAKHIENLLSRLGQ